MKFCDILNNNEDIIAITDFTNWKKENHINTASNIVVENNYNNVK